MEKGSSKACFGVEKRRMASLHGAPHIMCRLTALRHVLLSVVASASGYQPFAMRWYPESWRELASIGLLRLRVDLDLVVDDADGEGVDADDGREGFDLAGADAEGRAVQRAFDDVVEQESL